MSDPARPQLDVEPATTYTPMLWATMTDDQRYEEYIRVRQSAATLLAHRAVLREQAQAWRKSSQAHANYADRRDDPYDDVAHEHRVKSLTLRECADKLDAALSSGEGRPQDQEETT